MSADTPPPAEHRCGLVALIGRPNVGKSTLQNALVGFRVSIVSPKPQTTRHRILGIATRPGAQMLFVDTPGMHADAKRAINRQLNRAARGAIEEVDVLVHVVEAGRWTDEDERVWQALKAAGKPVLLAANKIDTLKNRDALLPFIAAATQGRDYAAVLLVSARRADGLKELEREIVARLPLAPPVYGEDEITDRSERFLAAELVREKIFRLLGDEVPYATTVAVESFAVDGGLRRIGIVVYVAKASQRAILLGEGGARMKAIATRARQDMERLFGGKVFLEVFVRVQRGWAATDASLARFGY